MSRPAHDRFERVIAENYEGLKAEVLATVRGKLVSDNLCSDPSDLDAAYNAAWHALYERFRRESEAVSNLGGWLATIAYRRAIDEIRSARLKYRAPVAVGENISQLGYEHDVDGEIADRQRYHQWLMSVRLRLNDREKQAIGLCVLHEHSRKEAGEIMGIDIKRLDKIMVAANRKLGGMLEAINRGDWCQDQRSLIKAYALGLHEEGGERHALAIEHVMQCQSCAAYVRSLRGITVLLPAPELLGGALGAGGGIAAGLTSLFKGGAAGGGGATLLGGLGAKTATVCAVVCVAGGTVILGGSVPDRAARNPPPVSAVVNRATSPNAVTTSPATKAAAQTRSRKTRASSKRTPPDPNSQGAQEIAELGIEPQATSTRQSSAASIPRPAAATEFDIEGP